MSENTERQPPAPDQGRSQRSQDEKIDWLCAEMTALRQDFQKAIYEGNGQGPLMSRMSSAEVKLKIGTFVGGAIVLAVVGIILERALGA